MADAAGRHRPGRAAFAGGLSRTARGDQCRLGLTARRSAGLAELRPAARDRQESWRGKYRGQSQKWFAFRFEGDESEIDIANPAGTHKAEFDAWRWAPLEETPDLIIPFKREVYREVARLFAGFAKP